MTREAIVVWTEDASVLADLVRIGCAAIAADSIPATAAVDEMRRRRILRVGAAFLDEIDPYEDEVEVEVVRVHELDPSGVASRARWAYPAGRADGAEDPRGPSAPTSIETP